MGWPGAKSSPVWPAGIIPSAPTEWPIVTSSIQVCALIGDTSEGESVPGCSVGAPVSEVSGAVDAASFGSSRPQPLSMARLAATVITVKDAIFIKLLLDSPWTG